MLRDDVRFPTPYCRIYRPKYLMLSNQTSHMIVTQFQCFSQYTIFYCSVSVSIYSKCYVTLILSSQHELFYYSGSVSTASKNSVVNPCPAEPRYVLPLQTVQIQISWLLKKPTDLDLHCLPFSM